MFREAVFNSLSMDIDGSDDAAPAFVRLVADDAALEFQRFSERS